MSFQLLSERLASLQESNVRLRELIVRLRETHWQPGSLPLNSDGDDVITELSTEIVQTLREQDDDLELLEEEAASLDAGHRGSELEERKVGFQEVIQRAIAELQELQIEYRHAQVIARKNVMAAQRLERELVLQSYLDPEAKSSSPISSHRPQASRPARDLTKEEQTANASSDVTLALRRTHDLMAGELSRSQFAHETLKESTAVLERLGETYGTLDTMLSASRNLLSTLISSQKSDTWYLETAFMVLSVTIGWLVFRRFIYGPAWWLIWLPLKLAYKSMMGVFAAAGLARGISSEQAVSVSSSLTHIHTSIPSNSQSSIVPPVEEPVSNGEQSSESISARVGKIIDGDELPPHEKNPKKRVWEEPVEGDTLIKDEL